MTASVSHEIKNALAIINENAGLLADLLLVARGGAPLPHDRLERLGQSVSRQVRRADTIVKNLNRFAHSSDHWTGQCNIEEMLVLVATLSARLLDHRGVAVQVAAGDDEVSVVTCPFVLQTLVGRSLQFAAGYVDADNTIHLAVEKDADENRILMTGLSLSRDVAVNPFPGEPETELLACIGGICRDDIQNGRLVIALPDDVTRCRAAVAED
jgi:signal transduction histidine kinase